MQSFPQKVVLGQESLCDGPSQSEVGLFQVWGVGYITSLERIERNANIVEECLWNVGDVVVVLLLLL